jgi:hypothetical protein
VTALRTPRPGIPLPRATDLSRPHWEGCREGRLRVQRCARCGAHVFIPRPFCPECLSDALEWVDSSGRGRVYSFTVIHRPQRPEYEVPYAVAIVELEEGWHMLSNLVDCEAEEVEIGMAVEVTFRRMSDEVALPFFRPAPPAVPRA